MFARPHRPVPPIPVQTNLISNGNTVIRSAEESIYENSMDPEHCYLPAIADEGEGATECTLKAPEEKVREKNATICAPHDLAIHLERHILRESI